MKKYLFITLFIFTILITYLVSADLTATVRGTGNKTFSISEGINITSSLFDISPSNSNAILSFNGNNLGMANTTNIFPINQFNIGGSNTINFSEDINNFTLIYDYYSTNGFCPSKKADECPSGQNCIKDKANIWVCLFPGQECNRNSNCLSTESCINSQCCDAQSPITLTAQASESCPGSAIPVVISNSACNSVSSVSVNFSLNNVIIRTGCTLAGDPTWDLDPDFRCGVTIPASTTAGTYDFKATYTINSVQYTKDFGNVVITSTCGTSTTCGHAAGFTNTSGEILTPIRLTASEIASEDSKYYIPRNTALRLTGINLFNMQCSDGVGWNGVYPGVVARTLNNLSEGLNISDNGLFNQGNCHIPLTKSRDSLIGADAKNDTGYLPPNCDISVATNVGAGHSPIASVHTFTNPGRYNVFADYINAYCDSPDYICPYINPSEASSICSVGSMIFDKSRANGWVNIGDYTIKVVDPKIEVNFLSSDFNTTNENVTFNYNISNKGIGKVNISPIVNTGDFNKIFSQGSLFSLNEGVTQQMIVYLVPKATTYRQLNSLSNKTTRNITLKDYSAYSFDNGKLTVSYSMPLNLSYDDGYGFASQPSQNILNNMDFSFNFNCNGSQNEVIELRDKIFYCTCLGNGFCIQNKTGPNAPCACINDPGRGESSYKKNWTFNGTDSFDDATAPNNLLFEWFYESVGNEKVNVKFYNGTGFAGANFTHYFPLSAFGKYSVRVNVTDGDNLLGIDRVNFTILSTPQCTEQNGQPYWFEDGNYTPSIKDCLREFPSQIKTCCPQGLSCQFDKKAPSTSKSKYACNLPLNDSETIYRCEDYKNETSCNDDRSSVSLSSVNEKLANKSLKCNQERTISTNPWCFESISNCRCSWNSSAGKCSSSYDYYNTCDTTPSKPQCTFTTEILEDTCNLGSMKVFVTANWTGNPSAPGECLSGERVIACGNKFALSFFSSISVLVSIILIILIYYLLVHSRKKN